MTGAPAGSVWSSPRRLLRVLDNLARAATWDALGVAPRAPTMVFVEVTRRCALRCRHCDIWTLKLRGEGGAPRPAHVGLRALARRELPAAELVAILGAMAPEGLVAVDLVGGEPLARRDLEEIVRGLHRAGLHVTLTTAAVGLERRAAALLDAGLDQLIVSLDGPDAATHDAVRGVPGTFDRALRGVRAFRRLARGRARLAVNTLVARPTFPRLPEMPALAARLGASQLRLSPYHRCYPFANGAARDGDLVPEAGELGPLRRAVEATAARAAALGLGTQSAGYLARVPDHFRGAIPAGACASGLLVCDVNAFGEVLGCDPRGQIHGSLRERSFGEIWSSRELDAHREARRGCSACWASCYQETAMRLSLPALWADRRAALRDLREYLR